MASANSILSPPAQSDSTTTALSAKRKREDSVESHNHTNGISTSSDSNSANNKIHKEVDPLVQDLVDVLKSYDTSPSILTRPLPEHSSTDEPQAKRLRAEAQPDSPSILTRLSSKYYVTLDDVLQDVNLVVGDIVEKLQVPASTGRNRYTPIPPQHLETFAKVSAFKKKAHELVIRERTDKEKKLGQGVTTTLNDPGFKSYGGASLTKTNFNPKVEESKVVLTLTGIGPRQLFSSFQKPVKVNGDDVLPPVREAGLPSGITTTKILSGSQFRPVEEEKQVQTLGELFPIPSSVPTLQPPKPSQNAITKSSTVGWYQPDPNDTGLKFYSYPRTKVVLGSWLDYSGSTSGVKRKQRDSTLSFSGKVPTIESEPVESEAAKLDSLFRSAYSSFAPTKDDTAAVVPSSQRNRLWWQKTGEKSLERMVKNYNTDESTEATTTEEDEMQQFQEAVESWDPESGWETPLTMDAEPEKSAEEKDVEEVLQGISELLETLNSYQRIRHISLNPGNRPASLLSQPDTTSSGTPSKPSEPEIATYEILKSQLSLLIATLPPYAVAKLNSDQIGELGISTKVEVQVEDHMGVLDEDEVAARATLAKNNARTAATSAAAGAANTTIIHRATPAPSMHRGSNASLYGSQFLTRTPAATSQLYSGASHTPVRPAQPNFQRQPSNTPNPYPQQRNSSAPYRPGYPNESFPQPPRPIPPYTNGQSFHHATPTTANYPRSGSQSYHTGPQPVIQPPMNRHPSQPYLQQSKQQNGTGYGTYSNAQYYSQQPSPHKPQFSAHAMPSAQSQGRPSFSASTPTSSFPQDRRQSHMSGQMTGNNMSSMMNGGRPSASPQMPPITRNFMMHGGRPSPGPMAISGNPMMNSGRPSPGPMAGNPMINNGRQSPQMPGNPMMNNGRQSSHQMLRNPMMNNGRQSPQMPGNHMMNGGRPSPSPQMPPSAGGWSTHMSTEEQASLMERQRAQLAQQQGTQHQARNAAQAGAGAMGSPGSQVNGGNAVAAGL